MRRISAISPYFQLSAFLILASAVLFLPREKEDDAKSILNEAMVRINKAACIRTIRYSELMGGVVEKYELPPHPDRTLRRTEVFSNKEAYALGKPTEIYISNPDGAWYIEPRLQSVCKLEYVSLAAAPDAASSRTQLPDDAKFSLRIVERGGEAFYLIGREIGIETQRLTQTERLDLRFLAYNMRVPAQNKHGTAPARIEYLIRQSDLVIYEVRILDAKKKILFEEAYDNVSYSFDPIENIQHLFAVPADYSVQTAKTNVELGAFMRAAVTAARKMPETKDPSDN